MMIGPSSGTGGGMQNRDANESSSIRSKRKVFDDHLDIDNFCDENCLQNGKKRYHLTELTSNGISSVVHGINGINNSTSSSIISSSQKSSSSSITYNAENAAFSPLSASEEISGSGSMARLEVLVVDGNWDDSSLGTNLTNLTNHNSNSVINSSINLSDIQSLDNYTAIPNYWETINNTPNSNGVNNNNNNNNHTPTDVFIPGNMQPAEDQENGNLSWLLDFKLDSFIEAPEDKCPILGSRENGNGMTNISNRFTGNNRMGNGSSSSGSVSSNYNNMHDIRRPYNNLHGGVTTASSVNIMGNIQNNDNINSTSSKNMSYGICNETRNLGSGRYGGPKKPPFTYTELIEHALQERGELTVSAIYQWISEHFPYYKSNDDRWKNSVRHNLSINPHFRKGSKAPHGAGHLWAIANRGETRPRQTTTPNGNGTLSGRSQLVGKNGQDNSYRKNGNNNLRSQLISQVVTMDEIAAATASIQQPEDNNEIINSVTLEHCAEQILSGIKREVEVQYLVPMVIPNNGNHNTSEENEQNDQSEQHRHLKETDFLNPVSKEVVAEECGLIGESYLVTDLNPTTLGLNMVEPETITPDNLFGEELSFQFYELTSPSQLQSA